jgi:transcriptional antiterminator Rof (Rho-off)
MQPYSPIDCDLYDELVSLIMCRQRCTIVYRNSNNQKIVLEDQPIDVYSQDKQEFLQLHNGTLIRLDRLIQVNQINFQN